MASAEDLDIEKTTMAHFMGRPPRSNLVKEKQPRERSLKRVTFGENEIQDDSKNQKNFIQTVDEYRSKRVTPLPVCHIITNLFSRIH